ncbi:DUF4247 domain-containing protein [Paenibacillus sp. BR2-3]|uniref:DUF4247 domain-containing protein n=1 Tax=Paenibacillus sp. BR2-3 TaxID=3048494 RepID=UPI0039773AAC
MEGVSSRWLKIIIVLGLLASLLSGCGAPNVKESYPLESVNRDGNATSFVYRASDQSVTEVAESLSAQKMPDQISPANDERMFLVYGSQWYHLQQDPQKPEDTLVEVNSEEYVRNNYDASFLQMYLTARLIGSLFNSGYGTGSYRGYGSRDIYKPSQGSYRMPTEQDKKIAPPITVVRQGLVSRRGRSGSVTGGTNGSDNGNTKGSISRERGGSGYFDAPRQRINKPQTRYRTGRIGRRGRR